MSVKKFIAYFVAAGVLIPTIWFAFYWGLGQHNESVTTWLLRNTWVETTKLMLWPSSILMLADPEDTSVALPVLSVALNAGLYALVGWLLWIGLSRSTFVLIALA